MDLTLDTITAMRRQEESGYMDRDFLHQDESDLSVPVGPLSVDVECRSKMTGWMYQVVDFCKFNRETVATAMNYLDRYLKTTAGLAACVDRQAYQLAAMTCLYTAVKIHEPEAMDPKLVSNLSRGTYTPQQVETMEANLLDALQWRVNPPTALAFVRQFLDLIPQDVLSEDVRQTAYDVTKYQTELAVNEYDFVRINVSTVAFCSFMNALESVGVDAKVISHTSYCLSHAIGVDCHEDSMYQVQNWLYEAVIRQPTGSFTLSHPTPVAKPIKTGRRMSIEVSPRSVSACR